MTVINKVISAATSESEYSNLLESDRFGIVSIFSHEAVGDGVTDDTVAIQAAIDAITKGVVDLANASCYIGSDITIDDNITLQNGTLIQALTAHVYMTGTRPKIKNVELNSNALQIDGNIILANTSFAVIDDVRIPGTNGFGIYCTTKADDTLIKDCHIPYSGMGILFNDSGVDRTYDGVDYSTVSLGSRLKVENCFLGAADKSAAGDGLEINAPNYGFTDVRVTDCTVLKAVYSSSNGIGLGFANCTNTLIRDNTVRAAQGIGGIHVEEGSNHKILDNTVLDCNGANAAGIVYEVTDNVRISGNTIGNCYKSINSANGSYVSKNIKITENTITEPIDFPILLYSNKHVEIKNNTIERYKGLNSNNIISLLTLSGNGVTHTDISDNSFVQGVDGTATTNLVFFSPESITNVLKDNKWDGYNPAYLPTDTTANNRIENYVRGTGMKGGLVWSDGTPQGFYSGRSGDLAVDVETGDIYKSTGGTNWTKIL